MINVLLKPHLSKNFMIVVLFLHIVNKRIFARKEEVTMAAKRHVTIMTKHNTYVFLQIRDDSGLVTNYVRGGVFGNETFLCSVPREPEIGKSCHIHVIRKISPCPKKVGTFSLETMAYPTSKVMQIIQEPFRSIDPDTTF